MKINEIIASNSAVTSQTSRSRDLGDNKIFAVHVKFTGADVVGTLTLEASSTDIDADYTTVDGSSVAVTASANHVYNVSNAGYQFVRVRWVYTSGTGDISAIITEKENSIKGG